MSHTATSRQRFAGRTVIVFGAGSSGDGWSNGKAAAVAYGREGASVVCVDLNAAAAEETASIIAGEGGAAEAIAADVTDSASVARAVAAAITRFGAIDVLHNNVGVTHMGGPAELSEKDFEASVALNLGSVYRTCKAVMRSMMKARRGRIVNIASVIGATGNAGQANYAAAKAGIIAFSKSLAKEIGSRNVTVNVVAPGFIDTDMTRDLPEDAKNAMLGQIALGRLGEPADIARAVAFLAGPDAGYITGETLHVNGGMYMA